MPFRGIKKQCMEIEMAEGQQTLSRHWMTLFPTRVTVSGDRAFSAGQKHFDLVIQTSDYVG